MEPISFAIAVLLFTVVGVAAGVATGVTPGLHVNNVALLLLACRAAFEEVVRAVVPGASSDDRSAVLAAFIVGTSIGHAFLDFVPSVYLGAPEEQTALAVLPGHRMLLEGEGHLAVRLAAAGAILGTVASVAFLVPLRLLLASPVDGYGRMEGAIALLLIGIELALILGERPRDGRRGLRARARRWGAAAGVFVLSGALGFLLLDTPNLSAWNWFPTPYRPTDLGTLVLFPLFTGLFGVSTLALSADSRVSIPEQDRQKGIRLVPPKRLARSVLSGAFAGALVSWLPGLSSGAATALAQLFARGSTEESSSRSRREFMVSLGAVSTATSVFTVAVLFIIDRARSGAAVAIRDLQAGPLDAWEPVSDPPGLLLVLVAAALLAASVAYPIAIGVSARAARRVHRLPYGLLARSVLGFLAVLVFVLAGAAGLLIAIVAGVLGLVPPIAGVKRVHLMGCLVVPVVLFYLGAG